MKQKLLLLHGALGSSQQFDVLKKIIEPAFEVHDLSFSGHGGLPITKSFSMDLFVGDVLKYLDSHQIESIDIFGYSMGGYVALMLAWVQPPCVKRIMTLGTKFKWTPESAANEMRMMAPEIIEEKFPKFAEVLRIRHHPENWKTVLHETNRMIESLGNAPGLKDDDLISITHEVLICVGNADNMVTQDESRNAAALLANGQFQSIPDFKHPIDMVDQTLLGKLVLDYFV